MLVPLRRLARAHGGHALAFSPSMARRFSTSSHFGVEAVGLVEVVLEQLAVSDVDRLRDHVGVGVLRDRRVEQARVVLRVDVLLDRAARAADADGVERDAVVLDEVLLQHQRGLAAELEVVVRVGAQAGRGDHRVAELQHVVAQHGAGADRALRAPDRDAALEAEDEAPVPERVVGLVGIGLRRRRQHRDAVDEAVDGAALPAHDVGHRLPVERRGHRDVGRQRTARARPAAGSAPPCCGTGTRSACCPRSSCSSR